MSDDVEIDAWVVHDARAFGPGEADRRREVERAFVALGVRFKLTTARSGSDADVAVRGALADRSPVIVSVGGDSGFSAMVDALIRATPDGTAASRPALGFVPAGTGADLPRTFGIPEDVRKACSHAVSPRTYEMDVVRVSAKTGDGDRTIHAANVIQVGMAADVTRTFLGEPTALGRARRFLAFWQTLARFKPASFRVEVGSKSFEGSARDVVVGNCQFASEGLRVSPRSFPGDGLLDVLVYTGPRSQAYRLMPKMWMGEQVPADDIVEMRGKRVTVDADRAMTVEADGAIVGTTPMTCELLPAAVRLRI
jgi:diacylglycerol kinase (ATP)